MPAMTRGGLVPALIAALAIALLAAATPAQADPCIGGFVCVTQPPCASALCSPDPVFSPGCTNTLCTFLYNQNHCDRALCINSPNTPMCDPVVLGSQITVEWDCINHYLPPLPTLPTPNPHAIPPAPPLPP